MKIRIYAANFEPEFVGCAPYNTHLAKKLAEMGHEVEVITTFPFYPNAMDREQARVSDVQLKAEYPLMIRRIACRRGNADGIVGRIFFELSFLARASRYLFIGRPELVVGISPNWAPAMLASLHRLKRLPVKILVQDVMWSAAEQAQVSNSIIINRILMLMESLPLRLSDSIGIISSSFKQELKKLGISEEKMILTQNYSVADIQPHANDECKRFWGYSDDTFIVLYSGTVGRKQGLHVLVSVAERLEHLYPKIRFVIVGDGKKKNEIADLISKLSNIELRGFVKESHYALLLGMANLLVVTELSTMRTSTLPSKLYDYLQSERPILAVTAKGSSTYEFSVEKGIMTVDSDDVEAVCEAVINCYLKEVPSVPLKYNRELAIQERLDWVLNGKR